MKISQISRRVSLKLAILSMVAILGFGLMDAWASSTEDKAGIALKNYPDGTAVRSLSRVPAPGIHPRIFLSPEDMPDLRQQVKTPARKEHYERLKLAIAAKFDNATSPEGKVMAILAEGKTPSEAQFAATTEMSYLLALAGIHGQIVDDAAYGKKLAMALKAWGEYRCRTWVRSLDVVGLHNSFDADICVAYDFIAPWMSEEQRDPVRRWISKMGQGIQIFTWDMPAHWRMWNWAGLHVYQGWASLAIEGEPGFQAHLWDQARVVARDFCNYNIHPSGALTEDVTYFSLGIQGSGLVMMAMAKRGEEDVWANTNISKVKTHLINQMNPWLDGAMMSHADGCGNGFYTAWTILKYMYPTDPVLDVAYRNRVGEDYNSLGMANDTGTRRWTAVLFNTATNSERLSLEQLKLDNTYFCPVRGYMVTRSDWRGNALKLDFEAKQDYPVVGHNHADANNFTLAALGREWATEIGYHGAAGHLHNEVLVDGLGQSIWPVPGGRWVDLVDTPDLTIGVSDASHPYNYHWSDTGWTVDNNPPNDKEKWEKETDPRVLKFYEGQENRTRTGIFDHWSPFILRSSWNPVQKAFRSATLSRGRYPYVLIADDIRKDDNIHLYEWIMQVPSDIEVIRAEGDQVVLGAKEFPKAKGADKALPDKRRLLVKLVDVDQDPQAVAMGIRLDSYQAANGPYEKANLSKRLVISARAVEPRFKVLLYPFLEGNAIPDVIWNEDKSECRLEWPDQCDRYEFAKADSGRTVFQCRRDGRAPCGLQAAPEAPRLLDGPRCFTESCLVAFALPAADQEIRYTLDGSEPTESASTFYTGPFSVKQSCTLKAATFARRWNFGPQTRSALVEIRFVLATLRPALSVEKLVPGVHVSVVGGFWNELPDFASLKPLFETMADRFIFPSGVPPKGFGIQFSAMIQVPCDGVYAFALRCDDAGKIWIDNQLVVDNDGAHVVQTRSGEIALSAGLHRITVANCDAALPLGKGKGDGSWAFQVLWAPSGAAFTEIPATMLRREADLKLSAVQYPHIAAMANVTVESGLDYARYDHRKSFGSANFLKLDGETPLMEALRETPETPDSSPSMLHGYRGFLRVPNSGLVEFALNSSGVGEIIIGDTVVSRVGIPDSNISQPVILERGLVPFEVKLGKCSGVLRWKGPGQDWQPISRLDFARLARPLVAVEQREAGQSSYELLRPTLVTLSPPSNLASAEIITTLDGTEPLANSPRYLKPLTLASTHQLRARLFINHQAVGKETRVNFTTRKLPEQDLIGHWTAEHYSNSILLNAVVGRASNLILPDGTQVVKDDQRGTAIQLDHSSKVMCNPTGILNNELTLTAWVKTNKDCVLMRYGYAHTGVFAGINNSGEFYAGGGRVWTAAKSQPKSISDDQWHLVAATYGGQPLREIRVFLDGRDQGSGRSSAPCLTSELELLAGFTGLLSELRIYNRILNPDEIATLSLLQR